MSQTIEVDVGIINHDKGNVGTCGLVASTGDIQQNSFEEYPANRNRGPHPLRAPR